MSRLVVVSNRVAVPGENRAGGLAVGLLAALKERGGLWFGWSGKSVREGSGTLHEQRDGDIQYVTMDLAKRDVDGYYNGFANRTLWPLLHFRLDLVDYDRGTRETYHKVNALFADKLAPLLREDDIVWIHDYHLIPLGAMLRERGIGCRIGFFLHIPMPSADLLQAMPDHLRLFSALYAYDLVGFQTQRDADRFQTYLRLFGGGRVHDNGELEAPGGRRFRAAAFPIGIDTALIARQASTAASKAAVKNLRGSLRDRQLAIGVDRLDYSKGLPERFLGFERYLQRHPDQRGSLTYLQIAPVSRGDVTEYRQLRSQLEQIAGHINGGHAEPDWTPLRYVNQNFTHATLTGFYRAAAVGLVTPLRDGMNLVAKEYVASQDPDDPGVLVLSLLAGAADELKQALDSCDQQGAYLRRTVLNTVADEYRERREGRRLQTLPLADAEHAGHPMPGDESLCPLQVAAQRQRLQRLGEALAELPERQREAFVLCRFDGLTQEEVAVRMQISRRMVVKHLSRALAYCEVRVRYASLAQMQELHRPGTAGEALAPAIDADLPCR